ncbi:MAG: Ig-like domain repeat protein [Thaumarchaeota archaeon]|nr:Ig-like domain repeat protein [Nitrososphaerota archaeon]
MKILGISFVWILLLCSLAAPIGFLSAFATVGSSTAIISSQNPSTFGHLVTFTAFVTPNNATGTVQFNDTSTSPPTTLGAGTLGITGNTTFSISSLSVGSHNIVARYLGDANNNSSVSGILVQTVNLASSTTTLSSNTTSILFGKSVNFTATVSPSSATGTVQFNDSSTMSHTVLGTGTISSGKATFVTSSLSVGSHGIIATYLGDTNDFSSASGTLVLTVNPVPVSSITTLSSNTTSILFGKSVNFTATVSPSSATGTIQFLINGTNFGSPVTLSGGKATFATSSLPAGTNKVTASYSGNSNLNPSTSNSITVTVANTVQGVTLGKVTGGGHIGKGVHFGFKVIADSNGKKKIKGILEYIDKNSKIKLHSNNMTSLSIDQSLTHASFSGKARVNGTSSFTFSVSITDPDKKGEHDTFSITITDGSGKVIYQNSGQVKGHIEIHKAHKDNPHDVKQVNEKDSDNEKNSDNEKDSDNENDKGKEKQDLSVKHNIETNNSHGNNKHKASKQQDD